MKYDSIIFDLDGTLLDTLEDLQDSVNFALTKLGYQTHDLQTIRSFVGNGIRKLVERSLPLNCSPKIVDNALILFKQYYNQNMSVKTKAYNGITELLDNIYQKYKLAIASNKAESAVIYLNNFYFKKYNILALGETESRQRKPSPDIINVAFSKLNIKNALYIGDSLVDIKTANAAKLDMLCVSWGFCDKSVLNDAGAKSIIDSPQEILNYL